MSGRNFLCASAALAASIIIFSCSHNYGITSGKIAQTLPIPAAIEGDAAADEYGICLISVMNLREDAAYEAEAATQTLMGTVCRVLDRKNGWTMVSTPDGYVAWVSEGSLHYTDGAGVISWKAAPRLIVTAHYTPLLSEPKAGSAMVRDAVRGCIVVNLGPEGKFYRCRLPDGIEAYVAKKDVADCRDYFSSQHPGGSDIVAEAMRFMGVPYMWGGTSIKAVDCSGLSQRVYMDCGIMLPRNASQQARSGDDIDISDGWSRLLPGDLLFFGRPRKDGSTSIYHVAIYIGDGQIIHSTRGRVQTSSIIANRANYFPGCSNIVSARRILGCEDSGKAVWRVINNGWYF